MPEKMHHSPAGKCKSKPQWDTTPHLLKWLSSKWKGSISEEVEKRKAVTGEDPDAGKDWRQEEKGATEDEMVAWHHQLNGHQVSSVQLLSRVWLCDPMDCSMPGLPVHHQPLEFTQTRVHRVSDAIQPSHPLLSPSPPASNPSQHQSLFQKSTFRMVKLLEFQL